MWTEVREIGKDHPLQTIRPRCLCTVPDRFRCIDYSEMSTVIPTDTIREEDAHRSSLSTDLLSPPLTDSGNGERFVKLHGQDVRYCPEYKAWFVWDGQRWKRDSTGRVHRVAKETARRLYVAALALPESQEDERKRIEKHARHSRGLKRLEQCWNAPATR